ncbi:MAG: tetratricopeptide repeat protein [Brevefilum sp.]
MTTLPTPENEQPDENFPEFEETTRQIDTPKNLTSNPDYIKLLELYQQAEFAKCKNMLDQLQESYPDHPVLNKFNDELEMKLSVKAMAASMEAGEQRIKRKATLNLSAFAIIGTVVVLIAFFLSLVFFMGGIDLPERPSAEEAAQLEINYLQAEQLLELGQPGLAADLIAKIQEVDPNYPNLADLTERTEQLLQLEAQYQTALEFVAENNPSEALAIFKSIEVENPGLWDVSEQIAALEAGNSMAQLIEDGHAAFQRQNWPQAITAYEGALNQYPNIDQPLVKERLSISYLQQTINLLNNENVSTPNLQVAESNYQKALALGPLSGASASEITNLQSQSKVLLTQIYTLRATDQLADKNQSLNSIVQAMIYLEKAADLNPDNATVGQDYQNAQYYQTGFERFINQDWDAAITNLEQVTATDPDFADGNAAILLVEAYYAISKQLNSDGGFAQAYAYLQKAEFLVWGDVEKLANLFQIQVLIGDTLGQMEEYQDATSYYLYALTAVQAPAKIQNNPTLASQWDSAVKSAANKQYQTAFRTFQDILANIDIIFTVNEIEVGSGVCLALFANTNLSTLDLVLEANNLPYEMVTTRATVLQVPRIE